MVILIAFRGINCNPKMMDIKSPIEKYQSVVHVPVDGNDIRKSIRIVLKANILNEFRTTVVVSLLTQKDIEAIVGEIAGARRYVLQKYHPTKALNKRYLKEKTYPDDDFIKIKNSWKKIS